MQSTQQTSCRGGNHTSVQPARYSVIVPCLASLLTVSLCGCTQSNDSEYHVPKPFVNTPVPTGTAATDLASTAGDPSLADDARSANPAAAPGPKRPGITSPDGRAASRQPTTSSTPAETISALAPLNASNFSAQQLLASAAPSTVAATAGATNSAGATNTADAAAGTPTAADPDREVKVLVPEQTFHREGKAGALRISFDDLDLLKVLNMDPVTEDAVSLMPGWLMGLNGQTIRLRGFMIPTFEAEGLTGFVLARDTQLCCFGRNPKPYDVIEVHLREGKECRYIHLRPFDVVGRLKIKLEASRGQILGLYWIEDAEVIEL